VSRYMAQGRAPLWRARGVAAGNAADLRPALGNSRKSAMGQDRSHRRSKARMKRCALQWAAWAAAWALARGCGMAVAQQPEKDAYPRQGRPIRFIVPYVPGGGVHFVGRT